jgi:hypothetical protein
MRIDRVVNLSSGERLYNMDMKVHYEDMGLILSVYSTALLATHDYWRRPCAFWGNSKEPIHPGWSSLSS